MLISLLHVNPAQCRLSVWCCSWPSCTLPPPECCTVG
uniref:Uncharacterized protein n=1 Tax=Anguilla anguilla TaxID=7936 RepID=A0A0E9TBM5_ANGAN